MPERTDRFSFVLLLWVEPRAGAAGTAGTAGSAGPAQAGDRPGGGPEWRWRIRRVQTGEEACFRSTAALLAYIAAQSGLPPPC